MPTAYDVLGVVFGAMSLLGCLKVAHDTLRSRQPEAQVQLYRAAMQEARGRVAELTRRGFCTPDAGVLLIKYSSALDKYCTFFNSECA